MNPIFKNIIAVITGIVGGSAVNMGLINLGNATIPLPPGVDVTNFETLKATIHLLEPINFVTPFLAHAIGTLAGAFIAALLATNQKMKFALGVGAFFLLGGIVSSIMIPAPVWFKILDITIAYLPMAWIGGRMAPVRRVLNS
jgi:hypothetical protein